MVDQKELEEVNAILQKRAKRDMKMLIHAILESPLKKGEFIQVDGNTPIEVVSKQNTDVQTRMLLKIAERASNGDIKSAEFLCRYGGYAPPVEQNINVNTPVIIDDLRDEDED